MARERLSLWSLGDMDSAIVRSVRGAKMLSYPIVAELASDAEGLQLYLVPAGGHKARASGYRSGGKAKQAYRDRYGRSPDTVRRTTIDPVGRAKSLGILFAVRYTDRDGTLRHHDFNKPRPYLQEYENGQLWIQGGSYRVTRRGIVG